MGFKAAEAVEQLTYDFHPHLDMAGDIPEPSDAQIDDYRESILTAIKATGIDPDSIEGGKIKVSFAEMDDLMDKSKDVEKAMMVATANITGIAQSDLRTLPPRVRNAFMGWVMGQFFDPEA